MLEAEIAEVVSRELSTELLSAEVREEVWQAVREALVRAKQLRKQQLETLRLTFQRKRLLKLWNRYVWYVLDVGVA